jgi:hypothetical protein
MLTCVFSSVLLRVLVHFAEVFNYTLILRVKNPKWAVGKR